MAIFLSLLFVAYGLGELLTNLGELPCRAGTGLSAYFPLLGTSRHAGRGDARQGAGFGGDAPRGPAGGAVREAARGILRPCRGERGFRVVRKHAARGHDVRLYGQLPPGEGSLRQGPRQHRLPCQAGGYGRISRPDG